MFTIYGRLNQEDNFKQTLLFCKYEMRMIKKIDLHHEIG